MFAFSGMKKELEEFRKFYIDKVIEKMNNPITPPKGQPMPQTVEYWEHLAELYGKTIVKQKDEISRLKRKINKLEQRK